MKRLFILMLVSLLFALEAKADTLDVCSPWDAAVNELPIHGSYADYGFRTEFIYADRWLTPMEGSVITELTFYSYNEAATYNETFTLYMETVADVYNGGHLLLSVICNGMDDGIRTSSLFQVRTMSANVNRAAYAHANSAHVMPATPGSVTNKLPSVTFTYQPSVISCSRPTGLQADTVWALGASFSWDSVASMDGGRG